MLDAELPTVRCLRPSGSRYAVLVYTFRDHGWFDPQPGEDVPATALRDADGRVAKHGGCYVLAKIPPGQRRRAEAMRRELARIS